MNAENEGLIKLKEITNILHKSLNGEQQDLCIETIRENLSQFDDRSVFAYDGVIICESLAELLHKKCNTEETEAILELITAKKKELGFDIYDKEPNIGNPR